MDNGALRTATVLITGANGFVGRALCSALAASGATVRSAVRRAGAPGQVAVGDLTGSTDWTQALTGCQSVVHLAARVHMMDEQSADPLTAYREVNRDATLHLARQAWEAGVKRFVFVSSIKVNGEATQTRPFHADDAPAPLDPYGQSKAEAEQALLALGRETGLEVVIVRPPLVYGPGVKANFLNLVRLVGAGAPLPFGRIRNARSMVALGNLVDLLMLCLHHPAAPGRIFLVSDGCDLSIGQLVSLIAAAMGRRAWLLPIPVGIIRGGAAMLGKKAMVERLCGSLQVDIDATRRILGWEPVLTPATAIAETVAHYAAQQKGTT